MSRRIQRVNQLLKEEVSKLLLREINFEGAIVTVTQTDTSPDLSQVKVKLTVFPTNKSEEVLKIIQRHIFTLQQILNKKLTMKNVPKIKFEIDQGEVKAQRIEEILGKIKKKH